MSDEPFTQSGIRRRTALISQLYVAHMISASTGPRKTMSRCWRLR